MVTRQEAQAALDAATAERDTISSNLLDLDGSFGKRLLSGASLTGQSKRRWETAAAALAKLWDTYTAYSGVIDKAADLLSASRDRDLAPVSALLSGRSVRLVAGPAPLGRRDLADTGVEEVTLTSAVARMRRDFAAVSEVVTAAEAVWGEVGGLLDAADGDLARATSLAAGLADAALTQAVAEATSAVAQQRVTLNSDPLSLWQEGPDGHSGQADSSGAGRAREQAATVAAKVAEVAAVRDSARQRIDALAATAATATAALRDALDARQRAAVKIAEEFLPALPASTAAGGFQRGELDALVRSGQWQRLSEQIDRAERDLVAQAASYRAVADAADATLGRREELRGMLQAYKSKAARLGAVEDLGLSEIYEAARDMLWTAPCDLGAAADAVAAYQQAILGIGRR
ncbi:MAG TPA: hypothetical protein VMG38_02015 [Trebonia sp.]|nr:hypothetical protein [Trebonia sp.]